MRKRYEREEAARLAPFAVRSGEAVRRHSIEDDGRAFDYRSQFQRDRDRIVYSRAFRRLRQKAQVGLLPAYEDHRRNRLTHTLEVTQVARTLGRSLRLNEDLIEAMALGHDLGQPPFGPAGSRALAQLLSGRLDGRGGPGLGDLGGFDRGWQGLRVVDRIEKRYRHPGLNLSDPVREGILKSGLGKGFAAPDAELEGVRAGQPALFEVQVVVLADRISSALSDLDDAMQGGVIEVARVERLRAVIALRRKLGASYPGRSGRFMKANTIHRGLLHLLITGAILQAERTLKRWASRNGVKTPRDFRARRDETIRGNEVDLPPAGRSMLADIEGLLEARVHRGFEADRVDGRGRRVVHGLFGAYWADPRLLEDHVLLRFKEQCGGSFLRDLPADDVEGEIVHRYHKDPRFVRLVADHLAAMTDAYAVTEHARLMQMGAIPIPGLEQLKREA